MVAQPKKTKADRKAEKEMRSKVKQASPALKKKLNKPLSKLAKKKARVNSSYWIEKCDTIFMRQAHGKPCSICRSEEGTVFHHHVAKSTCKALRYDLMNMIILCPLHHNFSNDIAAHSTNAYAQRTFMEWVEKNMPDKYIYCQGRQHSKARFKYKEVYEEFVALEKQGRVIQKVVA